MVGVVRFELTTFPLQREHANQTAPHSDNFGATSETESGFDPAIRIDEVTVSISTQKDLTNKEQMRPNLA